MRISRRFARCWCRRAPARFRTGEFPMCCFSRNVKLVADTNIFVRGSGDGRQYLVYSMVLDAREDLAMILPIPVPKDSKENAVRFINLEEYPKFFSELRAGFPVPRTLSARADTKDQPPANKLEV